MEAQVRREMNEWQTEYYTQNRWLHNIPADAYNDKRLEIRRRLWAERNRHRGVDGGSECVGAVGNIYRGNAIGMLSPFVVDCGLFLGEWRCKCLQAALLYLLRSSPFLEDVEQSLLAACGNHSPSGALADTLAITNACSAHTILQRFGCFVWVIRSHRAGGDTQDHGRWSFGDGAGLCA